MGLVLNTHAYLWHRKVSMVWVILVGIFEAIKAVLLVVIRQTTHIFHRFWSPNIFWIWVPSSSQMHLFAFELLKYTLVIVYRLLSESFIVKNMLMHLFCYRMKSLEVVEIWWNMWVVWRITTKSTASIASNMPTSMTHTMDTFRCQRYACVLRTRPTYGRFSG